MNKKLVLWLVGITFIIVLAACGDGGNKDSSPEAIADRSCIGCHGENLQGRDGLGPDLTKIGAKYNKEEILEIIKEGRPGMGANIIKGDDAEKVAAWLAEKK